MGIVAAVLAAGLGLLIFWLYRRSQTVVPDVADREAAKRDRVVAVDDAGRPVLESEEGDAEAPRDSAAFESVLHEEIDERKG
jgi:hypothetical protein